MKKITRKQVVEELAAIGFARATNFLRVSEGELTIRNTDSLSKADQAAIASIERSSTGIKLKFYDKMKTLVCSEKQVALGKIFETYVKEAGQNSRGVKLRPGLTVLNATTMPAILNEGAFVDNKKDIDDWNEDAELEKLGIAYALATADFLKLEKKVEQIVITLPVLAYGSKGETVKAMQILLKAMDNRLGTTGNFGSGTKSVLQKAQTALGLPATGKTDEQTWKALLGIRNGEGSA